MYLIITIYQWNYQYSDTSNNTCTIHSFLNHEFYSDEIKTSITNNIKNALNVFQIDACTILYEYVNKDHCNYCQILI